jgi:hypothetical protein
LRAYISGGKIHVHALPAALPFRVGEEASQHFGVQITLAFEIAVETAVGQTGAGHDLLNRNILEAMAIEKLPRALNDVFSYFCAVAGWVGHLALLRDQAREYGLNNGPLPSKILL